MRAYIFPPVNRRWSQTNSRDTGTWICSDKQQHLLQIPAVLHLHPPSPAEQTAWKAARWIGTRPEQTFLLNLCSVLQMGGFLQGCCRKSTRSIDLWDLLLWCPQHLNVCMNGAAGRLRSTHPNLKASWTSARISLIRDQRVGLREEGRETPTQQEFTVWREMHQCWSMCCTDVSHI